MAPVGSFPSDYPLAGAGRSGKGLPSVALLPADLPKASRPDRSAAGTARAPPPRVQEEAALSETPRYICIHCHFYQPPRENPWLDVIEVQDSAAPFHDWNGRINAECYATNRQARILNPAGEIRRLHNNYEHVSFNFGATLLSWLEQADPETYMAILRADRVSAERRGGHGNAVAQPYNHMIMPLASERDRMTQLVWGMEDFRSRFRRDPEGMWLSETAVDTATLADMAALGLKYTILAPQQARRFREAGGKWQDVSSGSIDPSRPYRIDLPGGRSMALFFYDGPISHAIAFGGILNNGEFFLGRIREAFNANRSWPQLVHIANDGESFGHHHRHGEMALAYALEKIQERQVAELTNYGAYLELHPPEAEAEIHESSSWSCVHGVERWRADCGCNTGGALSWNQRWRGPLREALDGLKERADRLFEDEAGRWFSDPWQTRNRYIHRLLGDDPDQGRSFVLEQARSDNLGAEEVSRCLRLLEMQRHAMLMFTSCGWFFDELSGIETVQNLSYASRVLQLAEELEQDWEEEFLDRLSRAPSNVPLFGNGRGVYDQLVRPAVVTFERVAAHFAIIHAMNGNGEDLSVPAAFEITPQDLSRFNDGSNTLLVGKATITSQATGDARNAVFAVLFFGGRDVRCGVSFNWSSHQYGRLRTDLVRAFEDQSLGDVIEVMTRSLPGETHGLPSLFLDARRDTLNGLINESVGEMGAVLRRIYDQNRPVMMLLNRAETPLPPAYKALAQVVLEGAVLEALEGFIGNGDEAPLHRLLDEAKRWHIHVDTSPLVARLEDHLKAEFETIAAEPSPEKILAFADGLKKIDQMGLEYPRWAIQNRFYARLKEVAELSTAAVVAPGSGKKRESERLRDAWRMLGKLLGFDAELLRRMLGPF